MNVARSRRGVPLKMRNFVGVLLNFAPVIASHFAPGGSLSFPCQLPLLLPLLLPLFPASSPKPQASRIPRPSPLYCHCDPPVGGEGFWSWARERLRLAIGYLSVAQRGRRGSNIMVWLPSIFRLNLRCRNSGTTTDKKRSLRTLFNNSATLCQTSSNYLLK